VFAERDAHDLGRKAIRDGCFVDVKSRFDAAALRGAGLRVWRL
jgi:UDP-N-acetyl-D-glucosamine/UDP-N-acetyl-D-galactosamine dehydrogenase